MVKLIVDCRGKCVLDNNRIQELHKLANLKERSDALNGANQLSMLQSLVAGVDSGTLRVPPMVPDTAALANGGILPAWSLDPSLIHPDMAGAFGIPLNAGMMKLLAAEYAIEKSTKPQITVNRKAVTCPLCEGLGFNHDSQLKHNKKKGERCKRCVVCRGT